MTHAGELAFARGFAACAHGDQEYGVGEPYLRHLEAVCITVAELGGSHEVQIAALLHDILEDTPILSADLLKAGFPKRVVELVRGVTKPLAQQPHAAWIADIILSGDNEVMLLKLADTRVNLAKTATLPEGPRKQRLISKYEPADRELSEALGLRRRS